MSNRVLVTGFLCVILAFAFFTAGLAQVSILPSPEAFVKGYGAIRIASDGKIGTFDLSVIKIGSQVSGFIKFTEGNTNATRTQIIFSSKIESLEIRGNFATIKAKGFWNRMPSDITVEVLDDNPSGDWFHIIAKPIGSLPVIYDVAGGVVKGDIVVYSRPENDCYAKGWGSISLNLGIAKFEFEATRLGGTTQGKLNYTEYSLITSVAKPKIVIDLPKVTELWVDGLEGSFSGIGTLNGIPAKIYVRVIDWSPTYRRPDEFYIKATPLVSSIFPAGGYKSGGPLSSGEISVGIIKPTDDHN